jgi:hypothetical protein
VLTSKRKEKMTSTLTLDANGWTVIQAVIPGGVIICLVLSKSASRVVNLKFRNSTEGHTDGGQDHYRHVESKQAITGEFWDLKDAHRILDNMNISVNPVEVLPLLGRVLITWSVQWWG